MKLYVMRHGPAEDHASSGQDFDRALTASGRQRVRGVADALVTAEESPLLVLTSPLVRAVQTAEIIAVVTGLSERAGTVETRRDLAAGSDGERLVRQKLAEGKKRVMVVGHEPDLSTLVSVLLAKAMPLPMDKAMVVALHLDSTTGKATLRFILDPKTLTWEHDAR